MEIRQLRYFVAVAEMQSFTKAAKMLFVSQSALSQQLGKLEDDIGLRLVDRTTRVVSLADAGREVLPSVRHILREVDHLASIDESSSDLLLGEPHEIRVGFDLRGMYNRDLRHTVTDSLFELRVLAPDLHVSFATLNYENLVSELEDGRVDLGFFLHQDKRLHGGDALEVRNLGQDEMVIAIRSTGDVGEGPNAARDVLREHGVCLLDRESMGSYQSMKIFQELGVEPRFYFASNRESMLMLLDSGEYASVLPRGVILGHDRSNVHAIRLGMADALLYWLAAWRKDDDSHIIDIILDAISCREGLFLA